LSDDLIRVINFVKNFINMKTKIFYLLLICIISFQLSYAQTKKANISFEKTVHDYGNMAEQDGTKSYDFKFTNMGGEPLIISNVRASCGCTSPDWTKEPIMPGQTGFIKATFDPRNRPGPFSKTITVMSNAETPSVVLTIKGNVSARPKTIEDEYPQTMGDLRLRSNHLALTRVFNNEVKTESLPIYNQSKSPMRLSFEEIPSHITIKTEPAVIQPEQAGVIVATYDANKINDWGFVMNRVNVIINGEKDMRNRLSISASIEEDFSKLTTAQKNNAPKISFETTNIDLGALKPGEKKDMDFVFTNTGKSPLIIHKVRAACGCTAIGPQETTIAPGKSSTIKAKFDTAGRTGRQSKTITVITNDPSNHSITLRFSGTIE